MGEFQEAEKILNQIVKNCEHNPAGVDKNAPQYLLSLYNLERYLGNQGKYEEGIAISKKGIVVRLSGEGRRISSRVFIQTCLE